MSDSSGISRQIQCFEIISVSVIIYPPPIPESISSWWNFWCEVDATSVNWFSTTIRCIITPIQVILEDGNANDDMGPSSRCHTFILTETVIRRFTIFYVFFLRRCIQACIIRINPLGILQNYTVAFNWSRIVWWFAIPTSRYQTHVTKASAPSPIGWPTRPLHHSHIDNIGIIAVSASTPEPTNNKNINIVLPPEERFTYSVLLLLNPLLCMRCSTNI